MTQEHSEVCYRTGGKQPHNLYEVTPENPEGVSVGHACRPDPELAARIVEALNELPKLRASRDEAQAEVERLGKIAMTAAADRERANEASRLSAAARDEADDLRRQIGGLNEQLGIVDQGRMDLVTELDRAEQAIARLLAGHDGCFAGQQAIATREERQSWEELLRACGGLLDNLAANALSVNLRRTAGDLAQRIVDEVGHPATGQRALGPDLRAQVRQLTASRAELVDELYPLRVQAQTVRSVAEGALRRADRPDGAWVSAQLVVETLGPSDAQGSARVESPADGDPEKRCHRCGGPNIAWAAPSPLWNQVMRGGDISAAEVHDGIVCPVCFAQLAEEAGIAELWRFDARRVWMPLQTVTPSGRVWNDRTWLWEEPTADGPTDPAVLEWELGATRSELRRRVTEGEQMLQLLRTLTEDRPVDDPMRLAVQALDLAGVRCSRCGGLDGTHVVRDCTDPEHAYKNAVDELERNAAATQPTGGPA